GRGTASDGAAGLGRIRKPAAASGPTADSKGFEADGESGSLPSFWPVSARIAAASIPSSMTARRPSSSWMHDGERHSTRAAGFSTYPANGAEPEVTPTPWQIQRLIDAVVHRVASLVFQLFAWAESRRASPSSRCPHLWIRLWTGCA